MYTPHKSLAAGVVLAVGALVAGCDHAPVAPEATAPLADTHATPDLSTGLIPFQVSVGFNVPFACLGGPVHLSGTVTGWYQEFITSSGQYSYEEYDDYSQLVASRGADTWHALPGSHEIWNQQASVTYETAVTLEHQGRTIFAPDEDDEPMLLFRHSIRRLKVPGGALLFDERTFSGTCLGTGS